MTTGDSAHAQRAGNLAAALRAGPARLAKDTSNVFRDLSDRRTGVDVGQLTHVLHVDPAAGWFDAEAMTPFDRLADETLAHGVMPCVVPELKSITIGGAVAGVGIESSSFRHGMVHESVLELDVVLADGTAVTCTPDNEFSDLFFGFPNSYGTLGYATRVRAKTVPVKPAVELRHQRFTDVDAYFRATNDVLDDDVDFVDGVIFAPQELVLTTARFVEDAPRTSDYTGEHIYYRSLRTESTDYLTTRDYLWRWDTDWFWCSKQLGAQYPLVRRLLGPKRLNSRFYTRVMRWNTRWGLVAKFERLAGLRRESVIQDVDVPIENAARFLDFFHREIGITPVWMCPARRPLNGASFPLFPMDATTTYINFGFWDILRFRTGYPDGYFNTRIERELDALGGLKSLYSSCWYPKEQFWAHYGGAHYQSLKAKYDPGRRLPDLYEKCVLAQ